MSDSSNYVVVVVVIVIAVVVVGVIFFHTFKNIGHWKAGFNAGNR